jgi:hypothetical protein
MRLISSLLIILGATDIAVAHSLDGSHGLAEQVGHQLIGIHHFPLTILLIAAGYIALKTCYRMLAGRERN